MKINLDILISVGDSIFMNDSFGRYEAEVTDISISYDSNHKDTPIVMIGWAQYDVGPDITELWDEDEINLNQLGISFWLTLEDMIKANKESWVTRQIAMDKHMIACDQEIDRCDTKERVGCEGCPYIGSCFYENRN